MGIASALGLSTTLEIRLALFAVAALALAGGVTYIHHAGYESCERPVVAAKKAQKASDVAIDTGVSHESDQSKAALVAPGGAASTPPPSLQLCQSGRMSARPATAKAQPGQPPAGGGDRGLPGGDEAAPPVDVGPVVQDLALAGVLGATNGELLWKRDVEQSQVKVPK